MIKLITDSAADFTLEEISRENLEVLSLLVIAKDREYKDTIEISSSELFNRMEAGEVFSTSQVPVVDFYNRFEFYAQRGIDIICYTLSKGISGTYDSAMMALEQVQKKYPNVKMAVIDSQSATAGMVLGYRYMEKAVNAGFSFEEVVELANFLRENTSHLFMVSDLQFLYRGGRLNKGQFLAGNLLNILPILSLEKGKIEVIGRARGKNSALKKILERIIEENNGRDLSLDTFTVIYGNELKDAEELKKRLVDGLPTKPKLDMRVLGSVIGAHTGPHIGGVASIKSALPEKFRSLYK